MIFPPVQAAHGVMSCTSAMTGTGLHIGQGTRGAFISESPTS